MWGSAPGRRAVGSAGRRKAAGGGIEELFISYSDWHAPAVAVHAMPSTARSRGAGVLLRHGRRYEGVCNRPDELALKEVELPGSSRSDPPSGRCVALLTGVRGQRGRRARGRGAGYKAAAAARDFSMLVFLSDRERSEAQRTCSRVHRNSLRHFSSLE